MDPLAALAEFAKSPLAGAFFSALTEALPKLWALFTHHGRDGFLVALDGTLQAARVEVDTALAAKHHPPAAAPNPSGPTPPDHGAPR